MAGAEVASKEAPNMAFTYQDSHERAVPRRSSPSLFGNRRASLLIGGHGRGLKKSMSLDYTTSKPLASVPESPESAMPVCLELLEGREQGTLEDSKDALMTSEEASSEVREKVAPQEDSQDLNMTHVVVSSEVGEMITQEEVRKDARITTDEASSGDEMIAGRSPNTAFFEHPIMVNTECETSRLQHEVQILTRDALAAKDIADSWQFLFNYAASTFYNSADVSCSSTNVGPRQAEEIKNLRREMQNEIVLARMNEAQVKSLQAELASAQGMQAQSPQRRDPRMKDLLQRRLSEGL
eukprot:gnl/MRDRNA2_/MRDRNA2_147494_c0_seq1.p1 gnl/MRDRNA2_/MRDRNA2_147494_c0~~gnl/MRDRNA2_/MRDRNA2_147494_c0_seq1.p1  ORF type:complete len:330 (-),score=76.60 gnl/MRDRNA2_/MRDRNA2_147494_c0_seq1:77-964(-)